VESWWIFMLLIGVSGMAVFLVQRSEKHRALRHMARRAPLSDTEFGQAFFSHDRANIAAKLRYLLQRHIVVDLSRIHPDDRIVEDLRMDALDSLSIAEFILDVEKEFGISIPNVIAEKMRTLRDVVDFVVATA
jgi:acyl carrier protein